MDKEKEAIFNHTVMANLMIRISILEKILMDNNLITAEKLNELIMIATQEIMNNVENKLKESQA